MPSQEELREQLATLSTTAEVGREDEPRLSDGPARLFLAFRDRPDVFLRFLRQRCKVKLWSRQEEIFYATFESPEVYVRSGNAVGKTYVAGVVGLSFLFVRQPSKVVYIATKIEQTKRQAWAEFLRLYQRVRQALLLLRPPLHLPEPRAQSVDLVPGQWFATVWGGADADPEAFQGFHAEHLLVVIDEASGVSDAVRAAIGRCLTSSGSRLLAIGNPVRRSGWFYEDQQDPPPFRRVIHVSALESPNVVEGRERIPGLATAAWVERMRLEYGENSPQWQVGVLGEFPEEGEAALFPYAAVQEALRAEARLDRSRVAVGVDVARYGTDATVICVLAGDAVAELRELRGLDTMSVVGAVVDTLRRWEVRRCAVDGTGIGAGVIDRLREQGFWVEEWNSASAPRDRTRFANLKAEVAWSLRERILSGKLRLVEHASLLRDLAAWRYEFTSGGQLRVVDPPRSPDAGDALLIAHWLQGLGREGRTWALGEGTLAGRLEW